MLSYASKLALVCLLAKLGGWVVGGSGKLKIKLNSAKLELELGLSLAIIVFTYAILSKPKQKVSHK